MPAESVTGRDMLKETSPHSCTGPFLRIDPLETPRFQTQQPSLAYEAPSFTVASARLERHRPLSTEGSSRQHAYQARLTTSQQSQIRLLRCQTVSRKGNRSMASEREADKATNPVRRATSFSPE